MSDPYQKLTEEQRDSVDREFKKLQESGGLNYKWHDSLLDLDIASYKGVTFPGLEPKDRPGNPGELLSYGCNGTDAYAVAGCPTSRF